MTESEESPSESEESPSPAEESPGRSGESPTEATTAEIRQRSELEIRWRQTRNAPPPVVRAVVANIAVAVVGGVILLLLDWLGGAEASGLAPVIYVIVVIISGSVLTYLWVELPTGASGERRRSAWAGVLGFFASIPIVYLSLVIIFQILRPLLS